MRKKFPLLLGLLLIIISTTPVLANTEDKMEWLLDRNHVEGYEDGTLQLENSISRSEFAKLIVMIQGYKSKALELENEPSKFSDIDQSHWAKGYINLAAQNGYIKGYKDGTFKPEKNITYEEAVTIVVRLHPEFIETTEYEGKWSQQYIDFAKEHNILQDLDITDRLSENATRRSTFEMNYNFGQDITRNKIEKYWEIN